MDIRNTIGLPLVILALAGTGLAFAQDPFADSGQNPSPARVSKPALAQWEPSRVGNNRAVQVTQARGAEPSEIQSALSKLRDAEDSEAKDDAKEELQEALSTKYDQRMDDYDKHIESLEKQLEEMRERLSRRRKAKDEVVELKFKQLVAEVEGLGWPGDSRNSLGRTSHSDIFGSQNFGNFNAPRYIIPRPSLPARVELPAAPTEPLARTPFSSPRKGK